MATSRKRPSQATKMECVQRIELHSSPVHSCAKRFGVSESTVKKWVKQHKEGSLVKRHSQWNPNWDKENIISHFLDLDILQSIQRGKPTYEDSIISLFDPEVDAINGLVHLEWTDADILKLCLWMVDRSMELIADVGLHTAEYQEEMAFIESSFFEKICKAFGYDHEELRRGVYRAVAKRAAEEDDKRELAEQKAMQRLIQAQDNIPSSIKMSTGYALLEKSSN